MSTYVIVSTIYFIAIGTSCLQFSSIAKQYHRTKHLNKLKPRLFCVLTWAIWLSGIAGVMLRFSTNQGISAIGEPMIVCCALTAIPVYSMNSVLKEWLIESKIT